AGTQHPKIQLLTIADLVERHQRIDLPPWTDWRTFNRAPRAKRPGNPRQNHLDFEDAEEDSS
ncbi:MAG TPA: hypothetical protein PLQ00_08050, partial [Thermoguttaceae bacterium]|nr:hypothetical protein [Thermoguttaceae bacterium]